MQWFSRAIDRDAPSPAAFAEDAEAERLYARHAEYFFRNGLGGIGMNRLALPGGIDINGLEFIYRDPKDFGVYEKMRTITYRELLDSGALIAGSPQTVREQIREFATDFRIGNLHTMLQFGSMPKELALQNIDLFTREVKPHLSSLWQDQGHQHYWWPVRLGGAVRNAADNKQLKEVAA